MSKKPETVVVDDPCDTFLTPRARQMIEELLAFSEKEERRLSVAQFPRREGKSLYTELVRRGREQQVDDLVAQGTCYVRWSDGENTTVTKHAVLRDHEEPSSEEDTTPIIRRRAQEAGGLEERAERWKKMRTAFGKAVAFGFDAEYDEPESPAWTSQYNEPPAEPEPDIMGITRRFCK